MVPVSASIKIAASAPTTGPVGQFSVWLEVMGRARLTSKSASPVRVSAREENPGARDRLQAAANADINKLLFMGISNSEGFSL